MTVIGTLSYAELAGMMPHAGGQYVYLREAYSPLPGFLYGWTCFLIIQTGSIAAVAVVFAKYLGVFVSRELGTSNISDGLSILNIRRALAARARGTADHFQAFNSFSISGAGLAWPSASSPFCRC